MNNRNATKWEKAEYTYFWHLIGKQKLVYWKTNREKFTKKKKSPTLFFFFAEKIGKHQKNKKKKN